MDINVTPEQGVTVVELSGDIDGKSAPQAQEKLLALVKEGKRLILDMSRVKFMSSAGLRMLLSLRRNLPPNGSLVLVGLSSQIKDTMAITGFLDIFTIRETVKEGKASLGLI